MRIKNLTPHSVVLIGDHGKIKVFRSNGVVRLSEQRKFFSKFLVDGVRVMVYKRFFSAGDALPEEKAGVRYIVSRIVAQAYPERRDFIVPDQLVRDGKGRVVGCCSFEVLGDKKR